MTDLHFMANFFRVIYFKTRNYCDAYYTIVRPFNKIMRTLLFELKMN